MNKILAYSYYFRNLLFISLFAFPLISLNFITLFFVLFACSTTLIAVIEKQAVVQSYGFIYLLFILPFIPYLIEFFLFHDNPVIKFESEKKIMFFVAPIIFYLSSLNIKKLNFYYGIKSFVISTSLASIIYLFIILFSGILFHNSSYDNEAYQIRHLFEIISGIHPTYFALFNTISTLFIVFSFSNYFKNTRIILMLFLFISFVLNFIIAAKTAILILVVGLFYITVIKTNSKKKKLQYFFAITFGVLCMFLLIPSFQNRTIDAISFFYNTPTNNTLFDRNYILLCSKTVLSQSIFTGFGARNAQGILDYCYVFYRFNKGYFWHFNSHNQFLTLAICYGIGILSLFIALLGVLFYKLKNNPLGIIFLASVFIIMFTESILERQIGIYFFLFFGLSFLSSSVDKRKGI